MAQTQGYTPIQVSEGSVEEGKGLLTQGESSIEEEAPFATPVASKRWTRTALAAAVTLLFAGVAAAVFVQRNGAKPIAVDEENVISMAEASWLDVFASGVKVTMSSPRSNSIARYGISGLATQCAVTNWVRNPWWQIEFPYPVDFTQVQMLNTFVDKQYVINRMDGMQIFVDGSWCKTANWERPGQTKTFNCKKTGTKLMIKLFKSSESLAICNIKVKGSKVPEIDLDAVGETSASSERYSSGRYMYSERAIDGKTGQDWCWVSNWNSNPWWKVDLGRKYNVKYVSVTNTAVNVGHVISRANPTKITVGGSTCKDGVTWSTNSQTRMVKCGSTKTGSDVKLQVFKSSESLSYCEVKVFGTYNIPSPPSGSYWMPKGSYCTQDYLVSGSSCGLSLDDSPFTCTKSYSPSGFWQDNLGGYYQITAILVESAVTMAVDIRVDGNMGKCGTAPWYDGAVVRAGEQVIIPCRSALGRRVSITPGRGVRFGMEICDVIIAHAPRR